MGSLNLIINRATFDHIALPKNQTAKLRIFAGFDGFIMEQSGFFEIA
jgi:hypothetical protein